MKKKDLIEILKDFPDDSELELGKFFTVPNQEFFEGKDNDVYEVRLDLPIVGVMYGENDTSITFIVKSESNIEKGYLRKFGKVFSYKS